jgi:hypothetical protein
MEYLINEISEYRLSENTLHNPITYGSGMHTIRKEKTLISHIFRRNVIILTMGLCKCFMFRIDAEETV